MPHPQSRPCAVELTRTFGDLGTSSPSESYLSAAELAIKRNPHEHGMLPSGAPSPVHSTDAIDEGRSDEVVILPWNLRREISGQLMYARNWGATFVVPFPRLEVF